MLEWNLIWPDQEELTDIISSYFLSVTSEEKHISETEKHYEEDFLNLHW